MRATTEPRAVRLALIALALAFLALFVMAPLAAVFAEAFSRGPAAYFASLRQPDSLAAIRLTLLTAAVVVPLNVGFGLAAAWAITKFQFRGRSALLSLIDLPLSVSPVISGMLFVLLFGRTGLLGPWLAEHGLRIVFAFPGIVLATLFVTFPLAAREIVPVMEAFGREEEEAARVLGAGAWSLFRRITLPSVKWGLLYGAILCNARAMGEFGAVSVVSGHIRGQTNTLPLQVENLYNEYDFQGAFALASLLTVLALATLVAQELVGSRSRAEAAPKESWREAA